jgi:uncharacterized protein
MPNNLAAFAIHADDVQRARRFYEGVFGWKFEPWGPPDFYLIHTGDERQQPRAQGDGPNCFECTISVDDVDAIAASVKKHGGKITMEKMPIPSVGTVIYLEDTEGNRVGAMKYDMPM